MAFIYVLIGVVAVALFVLALSVRIVKQYERVVLFELGKVKDGARGPGFMLIIPLVDRVHRVSLRIVTMPIQSQGIITKDNVSIDVSAVAYYRVQDPVRSVIAIESVAAAIDQIVKNSTVVFPAPLMSTISELGTFLSHETAAAAGLPDAPSNAQAPSADGAPHTAMANGNPAAR